LAEHDLLVGFGGGEELWGGEGAGGVAFGVFFLLSRVRLLPLMVLVLPRVLIGAWDEVGLGLLGRVAVGVQGLFLAHRLLDEEWDGLAGSLGALSSS